MSGGSMNYLYAKVLHCADFPLDTPEREAFAAHLKLVAQALHDIEWVDSGDYGPGDENAAIRACLNPAPLQQVERAMLGVWQDVPGAVNFGITDPAAPRCLYPDCVGGQSGTVCKPSCPGGTK